MKIEILWSDLTKKKQDELIGIFGDDFNDFIPIVEFEVEV